jgi:exodeoxyribonuclease-3
MLKIASWNVNSIKVRLPNLLAWLSEAEPDVVLLQETKSIDEKFPRLEIEDRGYNLAIHGQKTYNGVAILSKRPLEDVTMGLPGNEDDPQARYVEAITGGVRVASIYLPNGNPVATEKFPYKIAWMDHLCAHAETLLGYEEKVVLGGDYNIIPADLDVYDPYAWREDALCQPESRARFRALLNAGYTEAFRTLHPDKRAYSFWDYQAGRWQKGEGIRIDHLLLSPEAADELDACEIDAGPRGQEKASDHTPIWCTLRE